MKRGICIALGAALACTMSALPARAEENSQPPSHVQTSSPASSPTSSIPASSPSQSPSASQHTLAPTQPDTTPSESNTIVPHDSVRSLEGGTVQAPRAGTSRIFQDMYDGDAYYREVLWIGATGISTGWPDGTFHPHDGVTRGAMAAFLYRLVGQPSVSGTQTGFRDIAPSHPFAHAIMWMREAGISTGYTDDTYRPEDTISREALAVFLYRLVQTHAFQAAYPQSPYTQGTKNHYASPYTDTGFSPFQQELGWIAAMNLNVGKSGKTFAPYERVSRDVMAGFVYRIAGSPSFTPPSHPRPAAPQLPWSVAYGNGHYWYREMPWSGQETNYFCGPASSYMAMAATAHWYAADRTYLNQWNLAGAKFLRTAITHNTVWDYPRNLPGYRLENGLNAWLGYNAYTSHTSPTGNHFNYEVSRSFTTGYPLLVDTVEVRGGPHYNGHGNVSVSHILVVQGYTPANREVTFYDPGPAINFGRYRSFTWNANNFAASFLQAGYRGGHGMVYGR